MEKFAWNKVGDFADRLSEYEDADGHPFSVVELAEAIFWYRNFSDCGNRKYLTIDEIAQQLSQLSLCNKKIARDSLSKEIRFCHGVHELTPGYFITNLQKRKDLGKNYRRFVDAPQTVEITEYLISPPSIETQSSYEPMLRHLIDQVNHCFQFKLPDACAVMCRRIVEVLLVRAFEKSGELAAIQGPDDRIEGLGTVINKAKSGDHFQLDKGTKELLDMVWKAGNDAAHSHFYPLKMKDIEPMVPLMDKAITDLMNQAKVLPGKV